MPGATATPTLLTDPGFLYIAAVATADPTNTAAGSVFTDAWPAGYISLGATENGMEFKYATSVEALSVAEFLDPIKYVTTGREGSFAFNLADYTLTNFRRAVNGGIAAMTATSGTGATSLFTLSPPTPGAEVRAKIGWESLDHTVRMVGHQTISGGEITSAFTKPPGYAVIPCQFNMEVPSTGIPWTMWGAGAARGGV